LPFKSISWIRIIFKVLGILFYFSESWRNFTGWDLFWYIDKNMNRWITSGLLFVLGLSLIIHPLFHGFEKDPDSCAVTRLVNATPALLPSGPTTPLPGDRIIEKVEIIKKPASSPDITTPLSRGPPCS
jgi:hypothetical protein